MVKCTHTTTELNSENADAARIKAMTEKKTIGAFRKLTSLKESLDPTYRTNPANRQVRSGSKHTRKWAMRASRPAILSKSDRTYGFYGVGETAALAMRQWP